VLTYDDPLSYFAFNFNLRRHAQGGMWKRCYAAGGHGATHGLAPQDFHNACDRKGATVTMVWPYE